MKRIFLAIYTICVSNNPILIAITLIYKILYEIIKSILIIDLHIVLSLKGLSINEQEVIFIKLWIILSEKLNRIKNNELKTQYFNYTKKVFKQKKQSKGFFKIIKLIKKIENNHIKGENK